MVCIFVFQSDLSYGVYLFRTRPTSKSRISLGYRVFNNFTVNSPGHLTNKIIEHINSSDDRDRLLIIKNVTKSAGVEEVTDVELFLSNITLIKGNNKVILVDNDNDMNLQVEPERSYFER